VIDSSQVPVSPVPISPVPTHRNPDPSQRTQRLLKAFGPLSRVSYAASTSQFPVSPVPAAPSASRNSKFGHASANVSGLGTDTKRAAPAAMGGAMKETDRDFIPAQEAKNRRKALSISVNEIYDKTAAIFKRRRRNTMPPTEAPQASDGGGGGGGGRNIGSGASARPEAPRMGDGGGGGGDRNSGSGSGSGELAYSASRASRGSRGAVNEWSRPRSATSGSQPLPISRRRSLGNANKRPCPTSATFISRPLSGAGRFSQPGVSQPSPPGSSMTPSPLSCPHCHRVFIDGSYLARHIEIEHALTVGTPFSSICQYNATYWPPSPNIQLRPSSPPG
jgi:hypothetical protein